MLVEQGADGHLGTELLQQRIAGLREEQGIEPQLEETFRGIERRAIFLDDADREDFLRRFAELVFELGFLVFTWVLIDNHAHFVVRSANASISRLMARLGTGYARRFNERHGRVGHLFQNRHRSRRAVDDADLVGLVLYGAAVALTGRSILGDPMREPSPARAS